MVCVLLLMHANAVAASLNEYEVKGAYLLNFARFTEWQEADLPPQAPVSICLIGDDPFGQVLNRIVEGEVIEGHRITVQRVKSPDQATCHVAFFSKAHKDVTRALAAFPRSVLTVGEAESFLRDGGMISFVSENNRVRFDVNTAAIRSAAIRVSSRLLAVARSVDK